MVAKNPRDISAELSATGLLSETWQLDIEKGQAASLEVGLGEQVLWSAQQGSYPRK